MLKIACGDHKTEKPLRGGPETREAAELEQGSPAKEWSIGQLFIAVTTKHPAEQLKRRSDSSEVT